MLKQKYVYEGRSMVQFILKGNNLRETAEEHGVTKDVVKRRICQAGHTYAELVEMRKELKSKKS